jgi:hypothetical protein
MRILYYIGSPNKELMRPKKILLVYALLQGLIFALLMWAFDIAEKKPFEVTTFLFRLLFFGAAMGLTDYYFSRKRAARKSSESEEEQQQP